MTQQTVLASFVDKNFKRLFIRLFLQQHNTVFLYECWVEIFLSRNECLSFPNSDNIFCHWICWRVFWTKLSKLQISAVNFCHTRNSIENYQCSIFATSFTCTNCLFNLLGWFQFLINFEENLRKFCWFPVMSDINRYWQLLVHISENFAGFQSCKIILLWSVGTLTSLFRYRYQAKMQNWSSCSL